MVSSQPLPVNSAAAELSIWRDLNQAAFRERVDDLEKRNAYPGHPRVHKQAEWQIQKTSTHHVLPFDIEERIANDLAFVAAARKEAKAVSAVALEESTHSNGLTVRVAANGPIQPFVLHTLRSICVLLQDCAGRRLSRERCKDQIFDHVIGLHRDRIHSRLQSKHMKVPEKSKLPNGKAPQREPLSQDVKGLARFAAPNKQSASLTRTLSALSIVYLQADEITRNTEDEKKVLKKAVLKSHDFCTPNGRTIEQTVSSYGFKNPRQILENKHIRQINKIGRYWGLCEDLAKASRKYGSLFETTNLEAFPGYQVSKVGGLSRHVHAEIQLLTYYELQSNPNTLKPRILGVSKSACYLCNLFILNHGQFFITKTHGKLYRLWNIPDITDYSQAQRLDVRRVLTAMDREIQRDIKKKHQRRPWPTESFVHLPARFTSPIQSDLETLPSLHVSRVASPDAAIPQPTLSPATRNSVTHVHSQNKVCDHVDAHMPSTAPVPQLQPASTTSVAAGFKAVLQSTPSPIPAVTDDKSPSVSVSGPVSCQPPVERTITASSPFRSEIGGTWVTFEIDDPAHGRATITPTERNTDLRSGVPVDIGRLQDGESWTFARKDDEDSVVLNLRYANGQSTEIALLWL